MRKRACADEAYESKEHRKRLREQGINDRIMHRSHKNQEELPYWQRRRNALVSKVRTPVEGVFGTLKRSSGHWRTRYVGLEKNVAEAMFKVRRTTCGARTVVRGARRSDCVGGSASVWGRRPCGAPKTGRAGRDEGGLWGVRRGELAIGAARNCPIARNAQLCKGIQRERGRRTRAGGSPNPHPPLSRRASPRGDLCITRPIAIWRRFPCRGAPIRPT